MKNLHHSEIYHNIAGLWKTVAMTSATRVYDVSYLSWFRDMRVYFLIEMVKENL